MLTFILAFSKYFAKPFNIFIVAQSKEIAKSYCSISLSVFISSVPGKNLNILEYSGIIISGFLPYSFSALYIANPLPIASPSGFSCVNITIFSALSISSLILSKVITNSPHFYFFTLLNCITNYSCFPASKSIFLFFSIISLSFLIASAIILSIFSPYSIDSSNSNCKSGVTRKFIFLAICPLI